MRFEKGFFFFFAVIFFLGFVSSFSFSIPETYGGADPLFGNYQDAVYDNSYCQEGQDFILQVSPLGCSPTVVRSDLLEEQDVYVFCEIQALKINPLIDVSTIRDINLVSQGNSAFSGINVGFYPNKDVILGSKGELNDMSYQSLGYALIRIPRQPNESAMPDYVDGNLIADIDYDLESGMGLRKHTFYLPLLSDREFEQRMGQYSFFDNMGYLRAEDVDVNSASISIYSALLEDPYREKSSEKEIVDGFTLDVGETSNEVLLPGFDCLSYVTFRLEDIDSSDVRAVFKVGSETFELQEGESFLDDACNVREIDYRGINQQVEVACDEDKKTNRFVLSISPSIIFSVNGEKENYQVGDKLFEKEGKHVYLAYASREGNNVEDIRTFLIQVEGSEYEQKESLNSEEIRAAGKLADSYDKSGSAFSKAIKTVSGIFTGLTESIQGKEYVSLNYGEEVSMLENEIKLISLGNQENLRLKNSSLQDAYDLSLEDYNRVLNDYVGESYPTSSSISLDQHSLYQKILLSEYLNQKADLKEYCEEYVSLYGEKSTRFDLSVCESYAFSSNEGISTRDVLINGDYQRIYFKGVRVPSEEEYSAEIYVRDEVTGESFEYTLRKDVPVFLQEEDYVKLVQLNEDSAYIEFEANQSNLLEKAKTKAFGKEVIRKDVPASFSTRYTFTLKEINLQKVAKVTVKPGIKYSQSTANFTYNVSIEKRAIQLTPEKAQERADKLNGTIETWEKISDNLGTVVQTMKTACLATGTALVAKNVVLGADGETVARGEVMETWKEKCALEVAEGNYQNQDACYYAYSDDIDADVDGMIGVLKEQNEDIKEIEDSTSQIRSYLGEVQINSSEFTEKYAKEVANSLREYEPTLNISLPKEKDLDFSKLVDYMESGKGSSIGIYNKEKLRELDFELRQENKEDVYYLLSNMVESIDFLEEREELQRQIKSEGYEGESRFFSKEEKKIQSVYDGYATSESFSLPGRESGLPVQLITFELRDYYLILRESADGYVLDFDEEKPYIFDSNKNAVENEKELIGITDFFSKVTFVEKEFISCENSFVGEPEVRYYERAPYSGYPALVPLDKQKGWYAFVEQNLPSLGEDLVYSDSGRINKFKLCNVGKNGLVEVDKGLGDDMCQVINLDNVVYGSFDCIDEKEVKALVDDAVRGIGEAREQYSSEISDVDILNMRNVKVGRPYTNTASSVDCADYMSPKDCQILFNLCDPVICPDDRCDFGGEYPVQDVIQSGVIGSLTLCLPNYKEGIYFPVCLTGVKAGMDSFISVLGAYQSCLQESVDSGETVGVCDQIHSVYLCEFFWRQAVPLAEVSLPKLVNLVSGDNVRGGASYMGIQSAWKNAQDSVNFFTNSYAINSVKAFKARSQDSVGTEVCQNFISLSYPEGQGILDVLTESDSPAQYYASFEDIPYSTVTDPETSQYNVFYHIYAGKDQGAYYQVYFRGSTSSYYQDADIGRVVDSGYVPSGGYISETKNFIGPSGYEELCVRVNNQAECGFGQATTSFAANYVQDQYLKSQVSQTDITTEDECISGTANLLSLANTNVQAGASDLINPNIASKGITRICSTDNPGSSSDPYFGTKDQRWIEVGICGDNRMKCWLDTETVSDSFNWESSAEDALNESVQNYLEGYVDSDVVVEDSEFQNFVEDVEEISDPYGRISVIEDLFDKVFMSNHKAYLYKLRGDAYSEIAKSFWINYVETLVPEEINESEEEEGMEVFDKFDIFDAISGESYNSPVIWLKAHDSSNVIIQYGDGEWKYFAIQNELRFDSLISNLKKYEEGVQELSNSGVSDNLIMKSFLDELVLKKYSSGIEFVFDLFGNEGEGIYGIEEIYLDSGKVSVTKVNENVIFGLDLGGEEVYFSYLGGEWKWSKYPHFDSISWNELGENYAEYYSGWQYNIVNPLKKWVNFLGGDLEMSGSEFIFPKEYQYVKNILLDKNKLEGGLILLEGEEFWKKAGKVLIEGKKYDELILSYAEEYSVDPYFIKAIMKQESNFNPYAVSSTGCAGLMQFCFDTTKDYPEIFNVVEICSGKCNCGINCDLDDVVNCGCSLDDDRFDAEKSIHAGSRYLSSLINRYSSYSDSEKFALAAYNGGMGVVDELIKTLERKGEEITWENAAIILDADFLNQFNSYKTINREEKVKEIKKYVGEVLGHKLEFELQGFGEPISVDSFEESNFVESPDFELSGSRENILETIEGLEGTYSYIGNAGCYDAVKYIYEQAGVVDYCIYADNLNREYGAFGGIEIDGDTFGVPTNPVSSCYGNLGGTNLGENKKLSSLRPGDLLSLAYDEDTGHNAIFIKWVDYDSKRALLFDWNGEIYGPGAENSKGQICDGEWVRTKDGTKYCKTYQYVEYSLDDSDHPVYMVWAPELREEEVFVGGENNQNKFLGEDKIAELYSDNFPVLETINFCDDLNGDYGEVENVTAFVDLLFTTNILLEEEYNEISGTGGWFFNQPDDVDDVCVLLRRKGVVLEGDFFL